VLGVTLGAILFAALPYQYRVEPPMGGKA
jgi:hypothetical protein